MQSNTDISNFTCRYCGTIHLVGMCPRIKIIEYYNDGITIKKIEFHEPDTHTKCFKCSSDSVISIEGQPSCAGHWKDILSKEHK
jgi:hypothetical protein